MTQISITVWEFNIGFGDSFVPSDHEACVNYIGDLTHWPLGNLNEILDM